MFKQTKYYDSADVMPIGRYMLATCRDIKYFAIGHKLPARINRKKLTAAIERFNTTIIKNSNKRKVLNDIHNLSIDEGKIYLYSALMAVIDYCNELIARGVDKKVIDESIKPIAFLLKQLGLTPDSKNNIKRMNKLTRNFIIKSNEIKEQTKDKDAEKSAVFESYLRNLIIIEKAFNIRIDEQKDSVNKYVLLMDELNKQLIKEKANAKRR